MPHYVGNPKTDPVLENYPYLRRCRINAHANGQNLQNPSSAGTFTYPRPQDQHTPLLAPTRLRSSLSTSIFLLNTPQSLIRNTPKPCSHLDCKDCCQHDTSYSHGYYYCCSCLLVPESPRIPMLRQDNL